MQKQGENAGLKTRIPQQKSKKKTEKKCSENVASVLLPETKFY